MLNLASQICIGNKRVMNIPTKKKINTLASSTSLSSAPQRRQTPLAVSTSSKKQTGQRANVTETKTKLNAGASAMKGR